MSKLTKIAATAAVLPILALATPAFADVTVGQIESGDIYRVKNVTTSGSFQDSTTATCNDTVEFRVRVHNVGPDAITNVKVAATLDGTTGTSHSSKVSLTADNVLDNATVTASAGVTTDKATTISYVSGSTQLLDANENVLSNLPDGITTGSVNIGTVGPLTSNAEEVQFEAKLNCPTTPPVTPPTTTVTSTPTTLVNTGAGNVVGIFAAVSAAGALGYRLFLGRRLARASK